MRDLLVAGIVFLVLPFVLKFPHFGIYLWSWISYMNPHRMAYGFAYDFPFAYIIAITTLVGMMFSKEAKRIPWTRETITLLILIFWMLVTTLNAFQPADAWQQMEKVIKIQLMTFVTLMLITKRDRIDAFVWVIVLSLGFYGVKGGIFTAMGGGVSRVQGPVGTFIGGNNEIALALLMVLPLMRYLQLQASRFWVKHGLSIAMLLTVLAIVGSQSRGALVGAVMVGLVFWLKSRKKFFTALLIVLSVGLVAAIMPAEWYERMLTIKTYEADRSALGRLNSWGMAFNLAKSRVTGGGFDSFSENVFKAYAPDPNDVHDAHSIYFEMMGEHGFIGLGIFLVLGVFTWLTASKVIRETRNAPDRKWLADLAAMVQVSLVGYATAGAFLGLSYFDLYYHLICIVVLLKVISAKELEQSEVRPKRGKASVMTRSVDI